MYTRTLWHFEVCALHLTYESYPLYVEPQRANTILTVCGRRKTRERVWRVTNVGNVPCQTPDTYYIGNGKWFWTCDGVANSVNELRVLMLSKSACALNLVTPVACLSQLGLAVFSKLSHKHRYGGVSCPSHLTPCLYSFEANLSNSPSDKPVWFVQL